MIKAILTDQDTPWQYLSKEALKEYELSQLLDHLNADLAMAAVLVESPYYDTLVAVWCGAGEREDNFFWMGGPWEDPNDAEGGTLTAEQAIREALSGC